jgi:protein-S-isoprenylcysteine O-methyltransferase Ste14
VADVAQLILQLALGIVLPATVVRRDLRRLSAEQLARTWNTASFWTAVVAFGPFCLPVHFVKARRSVIGLVLGMFWMVAVIAGISLAVEGIALMSGTAIQ